MKFGAIFLAAAFVALLTLVVPAYATHDKTDSLTTSDGSIYVGEIKSVKYATLTFKTSAAGTLNIEWRYVTGLVSKFDYQVETTGGVRYYGTLEASEEPGYLRIIWEDEPIEVPLADVVIIAPIEKRFMKRLAGSFDFGLSYTQANEAIQYNLNFRSTYRSRRIFATLDAQSLFNRQEGGESSSQTYISFILAQRTKKKWSPFELGQVESNPDQGYDLRTNLGGGAVYFIVESSRKTLLLELGAVYSREEVTDSSRIDNSAAGLAGIIFRRFKHGTHSPSVEMSLVTFTNVTDTPRIRAVFNFETRWKIVGNFTFNVQLRDSYDSRPPGTDSNNNNVTFVTSVGYTF
jgi:hypothetical protein